MLIAGKNMHFDHSRLIGGNPLNNIIFCELLVLVLVKNKNSLAAQAIFQRTDPRVRTRCRTCEYLDRKENERWLESP